MKRELVQTLTFKWNRRTDDVSFIQSPDWDTAPEPIVGDSVKVAADGSTRFRAANRENPQIYHHKHEFVAPDYDGFSLAESRKRSQQWEALKPDKTRIGYRHYWDREVVPRLCTSCACPITDSSANVS